MIIDGICTGSLSAKQTSIPTDRKSLISLRTCSDELVLRHNLHEEINVLDALGQIATVVNNGMYKNNMDAEVVRSLKLIATYNGTLKKH